MKDFDESFVHIDINQLDEEWVGQSALYFKYAKKLEMARGRMDEAKAELEVTRAELDRDIRADPAEFGIEGRVTDKAIEAAVLIHERNQIALDAFHRAKHRVGIFNAAVTALEHRRSALSRLVELRLADYFSTPSAPAGSVEDRDAGRIVKRRIRSRKRRDDD